MMKDVILGDEVLIEFAQSGNSVRVTAIDPISYVEATIVGPVWAGEETLRRNAINKLIYVLRKKSENGSQNGSGFPRVARTAQSR